MSFESNLPIVQAVLYTSAGLQLPFDPTSNALLVSGTVSVAFPAIQTVTGSVGIGGPIALDRGGSPATPLFVSGAIGIYTQAIQGVSGSVSAYTQGAQLVSGSVGSYTQGPQAVSGSVSVFTQGAQQVSGTVNLGNWPVNVGVTGSVDVHTQGPQAVSGSVSVFTQGPQEISGTVKVGNWPVTAGVSGSVSVYTQGPQLVSGTVFVTTTGSFPVTGSVATYTQGTQGVSGSVSIFTQGAQQVSGTVNIGNWPPIVGVTGSVSSFTQGPQAISGSVSVYTQGAQAISGTVNVGGGVSVFTQGVQGVSGSVGVYTQGPQAVSGSVSVFTQGAQLVSGTVNLGNWPPIHGVTGSVSVYTQGAQLVSGTVTITATGSFPVTGTVATYTQGTQGVSGSVSVFTQGSQAVTGSVNVYTQGAQLVSGTVFVTSTGSLPVTGSLAVDNVVRITSTGSVLTVGPSFITTPNELLSGVYATVFPAGFLRSSDEPRQLFYDPFDGTILDTTNWLPVSASGGGVATTINNGNAVLGTGVAANGFSYLKSQNNFRLTVPGWMGISQAIKVETPISSSGYRFWGQGHPANAPTASSLLVSGTSLFDGVGWEIGSDGKLLAVVWNNNARTIIQDLSATGTGKQPTDGNFHRYIIYIRTDRMFWYIDSLDVPVATSNFQTPSNQTNPDLFLAIADNPAPAGSLSITCAGIANWDTAKNHTAISDGTYPWLKSTIKKPNTAAVAADTSIVVALSPNNNDVGLRPLATWKASQQTVGTAAVQVASSALANRRTISLKASCTTNQTIAINNANTVTTGTGYVLANGETIDLDLDSLATIWAIGSAAGQLLYIIEIAL